MHPRSQKHYFGRISSLRRHFYTISEKNLMTDTLRRPTLTERRTPCTERYYPHPHTLPVFYRPSSLTDNLTAHRQETPSGFMRKRRLRVSNPLRILASLAMVFPLCQSAFKHPQSLETKSNVAVCLYGGFNALAQSQAQVNLRKYILEPLNAPLFLDLDLRHDDETKHIFSRPAFFKEPLLGLATNINFRPLAKRREFSSEDPGICSNITGLRRFKKRIDQLIPHVKHMYNCPDLIEREENNSLQNFEWVWMAITDVLYFPSPEIQALVQMKHDTPIVWIDLISLEHGTEVGGRVGLFSRESLTIYMTLIERLKHAACTGGIDTSICIRPNTPECLLTWFWKSRNRVTVLSLQDLVKWKLWRRCGSPKDCKDLVEWLKRVCKIRPQTTLCRHARSSVAYYREFPEFLLK